ncbi:uncharacterized protein MONBRDRAFT_14998 [Monosiga brevicollis MX1]|uniref:guanylate cyclase n=1 Tax=Monosiga brevicollis TaxID=81824 RepID=A9UU55_MONBE|nr:uncharacterized protein MONBRDRAFT_14998 [Monosiga brevicollis MX1]EDQ91608.1 predicted protein [Monosiga brevicollis MX1]|eukprot:XP_001744030.1 hypothetical protein [Monosiga brevicollis MX1]
MAGLQGVDILQAHVNYNDKDTLMILDAACKVLGRTLDDLLYQVGIAFLDLTEERSYDKLLLAMGSTFHEFMENLDNLHQFLSLIYPEVAQRYYSMEIEMTYLERKAQGAHHDVFFIQLPFHYRARRRQTLEAIGPMGSVSGLTTAQVDELFPWHIEFDETLAIRSLGTALHRLIPNFHEGMSLNKLVRVIRPVLTKLSFDSICKHNNVCYLMEIRNTDTEEPTLSQSNLRPAMNTAMMPTHAGPISMPPRSPNIALLQQQACPFTSSASSRKDSVASLASMMTILHATSCLKMKGQILQISTSRALFLGLPSLRSLEDLQERGVSISDFPASSGARDFLLANNHLLATINLVSQLEETTAFLDRALADVRIEKDKSEALLHTMLPESIASRLAEGSSVEPKEYDTCAMLFSDICSFTSMSAQVSPKAIMEMLDELFLGFDRLCDKHGVYKYETIGDCFIVATGLPEPDELYAARIAAFAIDLVKFSSTVMSPADGKPLSVRCGFNCGPVVTGIVGKERPKFNILGDCVNTASRMESTGVPNCIQLTEHMRDMIVAQNPAFRFVARKGGVKAKGKGHMQTYFLVGYEQVDAELLPPPMFIEQNLLDSAYTSVGSQEESMPSVQPSPFTQSSLIRRRMTSIV